MTHEEMGEAKYNNNKYRNQQIRIIGYPVRENEHNDGQESSDAAQSLSTYVVRLSPSPRPKAFMNDLTEWFTVLFSAF